MDAPPDPLVRPFRSRAFLGNLLVIAVFGSLPIGLILAAAAIEALRLPGRLGAEFVRIAIGAYFLSLFALIAILFLIPELEQKLRRSERSVLVLTCFFFLLGSSVCFGGLFFLGGP